MKTGTKEIIREENLELDGAHYTYTLSCGEGKSVANYGLTLYSIGIEMTDADGNKTKSELDEIFADSKRAFGFFQRLIENYATPIDLPYILEDEMR